MISIQDVGTEIFEGRPRPLYVFLGEEYGVKVKYIKLLQSKFKCEVKSIEKMSELIEFLSTKHFVPIEPAIYVVRYDEEFVSKVDTAMAERVLQLKYEGVIILLYEQPKHATKPSKMFPDNAVTMEKVSARFLFKYLRQDFPQIPDKIINALLTQIDSYYLLQLICSSITSSPAVIQKLSGMSDAEICKLFGVEATTEDKLIKLATASRNFKVLVSLLEHYPDSGDSFIYSMLSALLELEKVLTNSRVDSELRQYTQVWTLEDVYNMFMQTYNQLNALRTITQDSTSVLLYLFSLLQFKQIPSVEVMR